MTSPVYLRLVPPPSETRRSPLYDAYDIRRPAPPLHVQLLAGALGGVFVGLGVIALQALGHWLGWLP